MKKQLNKNTAYAILLIVLAVLVPNIIFADWVTTTIIAGDQPRTVAINPVTNKIYIANENSDDVTVIDGATNNATTLLVGAQPHAIAVNPATNKIYVANAGSDNVTVIDGENNNTTTVPAVDGPVAIAVNSVSNKIYVANGNSGNVTVIDGATNDTTIVPVGMAPYAICVNPVTNRIYVANAFSNNVTVIDGDDNSTASVYVGNIPMAIAMNPVTNKIYVANFFDDAVAVINGDSHSIGFVSVGSTPSAICVNPVTNKIYVTTKDAVVVIDGNTNGKTFINIADGCNAVTVNSVTNKIYVVRNSSDSVTVVQGDDNSTISLAVGDGSIAVAANPVTNKIYVVNQNGDDVTVIDGADNDSVSVATGDAPQSVCVNPVTNKIYVVNQNSNDITVVDGDDNSYTTVPAGDAPTAVCVNPVTNKIYVVNQNSDDMTVVDGDDNSYTTVPAGDAPTAVSVDPVTNRIYVSNKGSNNVTVISGGDNSILVTVPVGVSPEAIIVNPVTNKIYVANQGSDSVTVIDGNDYNTESVAVGDAPSAVCVNPVTNEIYVANQGSNTVTVIDGATNNTTDIIVGNQPYAIVVNSATNKIYVANQGSNTVTVIDGITNNTTDIIVENQPYAIVVNSATNKIYVANQGSNSVTVIDGTTNSTITVGTGSEPITVAVNPVTNKIYVANSSSDNMTVIDAVNEHETGVIVEIDGSLNNSTYEAMPTVTGKAVNHWNPNATTMLGALDNWLAGQEEWTWATVTSGAGTDSIQWQCSWNGDSLIYGENYINIVPLESQAGTANNLGLGTPFAGNMLVYPIYRFDSPLNSFSLISPSDSAMLSNPRPTFIWETSCDTSSGLEAYEIYIDGIVRYTGVDTSWTADYDLSEGWHNWYIVAYDIVGDSLQSIENWSVLIDFTVPSVVSLISPSNGDMLNNTSVNFIWNKSSDVLSAIEDYVLQYTQNNTFSSGVIETTLVDTTFTTVLFDTTYYWRVKARDQATNESDWSSVWSFEIDTQAPNAPNLISPTNGIWLSDTLVTFEWTEVTKFIYSAERIKRKNIDRESDKTVRSQVNYIIQVDTLFDFASPLITDTLGETSTTFLLFEDFYYWRIKAFDLAGNQGSYVNPDSFGVDITAPVIESTTVWNDTTFIGPFEIKTKITDNLSGVDSVLLYYKRNEDPEWISVIMNSSGTSGWYVDSVPEVSNTDDTVRYYIEAIDRSEPCNIATDPEDAPIDYYWFIANHDPGIMEYENIPTSFSFGLKSNPARGKAVFNLALPQAGLVTLRIYDVSGRLIDKVISGRKSAGFYEIPWIKEVSSGIFFYHLDSPWQQKIGKLVLIR
jgi:YVTN family beta-propeller protein